MNKAESDFKIETALDFLTYQVKDRVYFSRRLNDITRFRQ